MEPASESIGSPLEQQSRSAPLIERAPLPMVEVEGPAHTLCFANIAFCRLLNAKQRDLIGKPFAEIISNAASCIPLLDRVYKTGEFETHAERDESETDPGYWLYAMWPALDGHKRPARVVIQLTKTQRFQQTATEMNEALLIGAMRQHELRDAAEKMNAQLKVEIFERERTEVALQAAQAKLRADAEKLERKVIERTSQLRASVGELEAFSYSLAHDLRAPVRAIQGFTQLALEMADDEVGPSAAELLKRVIKAASRMDSLIKDVLSLSQVISQPIKIGAVDVEELVRALIAERPELSSPAAKIEIESPLLQMLGHEASLSQCLTNLLNNAVKFVRPGEVPRVRVWTEKISGPDLQNIRLDSDPPFKTPGGAEHRVRLWVEDHGIGIESEAMETIFEIFIRLHSSSRYEGSGIGLAIVRKAMERMGGRVGVYSEVNKGSRFWLELPGE